MIKKFLLYFESGLEIRDQIIFNSTSCGTFCFMPEHGGNIMYRSFHSFQRGAKESSETVRREGLTKQNLGLLINVMVIINLVAK